MPNSVMDANGVQGAGHDAQPRGTAGQADGHHAGAGRDVRPHPQRGADEVRARPCGRSRPEGEAGAAPSRAAGEAAAEHGNAAGAPASPAPPTSTRFTDINANAIELELIEMALNKDEILDAVAGMTVLELSELIKMMEEKFGVSAAAAAVAVAAPAGGGAAAAPVEEQTEFTVMLLAAGEKKVEAIKVVRASYRPGPEGSQGSGRRCSEGGQGRHFQGRRRRTEEAARGRRREGRGQVRS